MDQAAIRAIQAMLAPVVLTTTAAILAGGIQTMYAAVNDRMRAMTAERLSRLTGASGELTTATALPGAARERLGEIDTQLPLLLRRHWLLHNALVLIYLAVLIVVVAMVLIAVSITVPTAAVGDLALGFLLASTVALLLGLILVAVSVRHSANAVDYEVRHVLRLGSQPAGRRVASSGSPLQRPGVHVCLSARSWCGKRSRTTSWDPDSPHRTAPDHDYYAAVKKAHNGKQAPISIARKLARRCYHTLGAVDPDRVYAIPV